MPNNVPPSSGEYELGRSDAMSQDLRELLLQSSELSQGNARQIAVLMGRIGR